MTVQYFLQSQELAQVSLGCKHWQVAPQSLSLPSGNPEAAASWAIFEGRLAAFHYSVQKAFVYTPVSLKQQWFWHLLILIPEASPRSFWSNRGQQTSPYRYKLVWSTNAIPTCGRCPRQIPVTTCPHRLGTVFGTPALNQQPANG